MESSVKGCDNDKPVYTSPGFPALAMESSVKGCDNSGWCRRPGAPTTSSVTADLREPDKRATGSRLEGLGLGRVSGRG